MILVNLNNTVKKPGRLSWRGNAKVNLVFKIAFIAGVAAFVGSFPLWANAPEPAPTVTEDRNPDSLQFPTYRDTKDEDDILDQYPAYLNFVLKIGYQVNRRAAQRLHRKYKVLRKYSPEAAARFLRGLRFEMTQKLQYVHLNPQRVTTRNRTMQRWVKRHINSWYHEADEYLFRAVVYKKTNRRWY